MNEAPCNRTPDPNRVDTQLEKNGWKTANKKEVRNKALWTRIRSIK